MRSPYMDILEAASAEPKEFILPSRYEAGVAATCVRSLGQSHGVEHLQIRLLGAVLFVWIGRARKINFTPPSLPRIGVKWRGRGRPLKKPVTNVRNDAPGEALGA